MMRPRIQVKFIILVGLLLLASIVATVILYLKNSGLLHFGGTNGGFETPFKWPNVLPRSHGSKNTPMRRGLILFWVPYFSEADYSFGLGTEAFSDAGCAVDACETTSDRSRLVSANAVIFHLSNILSDDLPTVRYDDQRWVFFTMEAPAHTALVGSARAITDLHAFDGHFNWTMTYRRDSDIRLPYFEVIKREVSNEKIATGRKKKTNGRERRLVSWLASNCRTSGLRERYVEALRSHVPVDVYGECGKPCRPRRSSKCVRQAIDDHSFYLAFENSVCRDYVTEKMSNALTRGVVPVVYGGSDYADVAPPNSFIDVRDFASPGHLARRLVQLDANETAYDELLSWQSRYEIRTGRDVVRRAFCDLCAALHDDDGDRPRKFYEQLHEWWIERGNCATIVDVLPLGYPRLSHRLKLAALELAHGFPRLQ